MVERVHILTLSDRASAGVYEDKATPGLRDWLLQHGAGEVTTTLQSDDPVAAEDALRGLVEIGVPLVLTCGGTGFGPRDLAPEVTRMVITREAPGICEYIRTHGSHPMSPLSRAVCGIAGRTIILNLSGGPKGAVEQLDLAWPLLLHAVDTLKGGGHG